MTATRTSFRISWGALALGGLIALLTPLLAVRMASSPPGWDDVPASLDMLFGGLSLAAFCFLVSFGSGLRVWRERKVVLIWAVPIGACLLLAVGLGVIALVAPYWDPGLL